MITLSNTLTYNLQISYNSSCKASFRRQVQEWFSSKQNQQIQNYIRPKDVKFDMKMNVLKSQQAKLITFLFDRIKSRSGTITIGWKKIRHYSFFATGYTLKERITICGTNPTFFWRNWSKRKYFFELSFIRFTPKRLLRDKNILKSANMSVSGARV